MSGLNSFDNTLTVAGKHKPDCDTQLGPEYGVVGDELCMTIHICLGCLPMFDGVE